jgi:putative radical SAM enzyme (TIGR03279 family)
VAIIIDLIKGSPADKAGLKVGDRLLSINNHPLRDIIDYQILCENEKLDLEIERNSRRYQFKICKAEAESLGLRFASSLFDGVKRCNNRCIFCFIDQLPKGLRKSLYLKDDDYRLSFLYGNFITLTNLDDTEVERIIRSKLSPLYISLHTTNPELRLQMLRPSGQDRALLILSELIKNGVKLHIQVVLCPGLNDRAELERTLKDLASYSQGIESIGIVPVGLTKFRQPSAYIRKFKKGEIRTLIRQVGRWQRLFRKKQGKSWVYLADEFYLTTNLPIPVAEEYDEFPQIENGIGLTRSFLDQVKQEIETLSSTYETSKKLRVGLITSVLGKRVLSEALPVIREKIKIDVQVLPVKNKFLGPTVTVTGLLAGQDIINTLKRALQITNYQYFFLPAIVANSDNLLLDSLSLTELCQTMKIPIKVIRTTGRDLISALVEVG